MRGAGTFERCWRCGCSASIDWCRTSWIWVCTLRCAMPPSRWVCKCLAASCSIHWVPLRTSPPSRVSSWTAAIRRSPTPFRTSHASAHWWESTRVRCARSRTLISICTPPRIRRWPSPPTACPTPSGRAPSLVASAWWPTPVAATPSSCTTNWGMLPHRPKKDHLRVTRASLLQALPGELQPTLLATGSPPEPPCTATSLSSTASSAFSVCSAPSSPDIRPRATVKRASHFRSGSRSDSPAQAHRCAPAWCRLSPISAR
mmetsp:Transcript_31472/g.78972  ORF Transcript_31472/g.78972 Transcript_31472/m.78972 type:complete len:259 (+) Transcript_31472:470-1246(+)